MVDRPDLGEEPLLILLGILESEKEMVRNLTQKPTKVYYGCNVNHGFSYDLDLEPLGKSLYSLPNNVELSKCPSFVKHTKNMYLLRCPYDTEVWKGKEGWSWGISLSDKNEKGEVINKILVIQEEKEFLPHVQLYNNYFLRLIAENTCNLTVLPPYLHHNKLYGVSGEFDISKWFRTIPSATVAYPFTLKRGEPLLYLKFDRAVDLQRVGIPDVGNNIEYTCLNYKNNSPRTGLEKLYDKFTRSGANKVLLKAIKDYNGIK